MSDKEKFEVDGNEEDPMSYSSGMPPDWRFGANSSVGLVSIGNSMSMNRGDLIGSSSCSSASMVDSFSPNFWDHSANSQNLGFCDINGSSSNTVGIRKDGFGFGRGGHDHGTLEIGWNQANAMMKGDGFLPNGQGVFPQSLSQFPTDSGFIERAARFSCFGGGNFSDVVNAYGVPQSMAMYAGAIHGTRDALAGIGLRVANGGPSQESYNPNVVEAATKGVSPSVEQLATRESHLNNDKSEGRVVSQDEGKQALVQNVNDSDRGESGDDDGGRGGQDGSPMLEGTTSGEPSMKGLNSKKRKRSGQDADNYKPNGAQELQSEGAKDNPENQQKGDQQPTSTMKASGKNAKQGSQNSDPPKEEYIHVRARRGQATNSHSLAERVRREKISERMKFLQELVPGCSKVTGKAVMLDEIINYVQSLQRQVEFLSMKLATVNPRLDFNIESLLAKDILHQRPGPSSTLGFPLEMSMNFPPLHPSQPGMIQTVIPNMANPSDILRRTIHTQLTPLSGGFKEPNQMPDVWADELHNVVQMSIATTAPMSSQDVDDGNNYGQSFTHDLPNLKALGETYKEKMEKASDNGTKEVDPATQLNLWAESAGGKTRGRLYGTGDMAKRYKPGVSSLTQQSHVSPYTSQVSAGIAAQMAAIEERANAAEDDARVAREECRKANKRTQDLERQLKELAESVASIKGGRHRRHPDYDDDSDTDADSVDSVED